MSCLPKPVLRGHTKRFGIKVVTMALSFGAINAALYHFFVGVRRQNKYHEFLRDYDPDFHFNDMVKCGVLKTVKAIQASQKD